MRHYSLWVLLFICFFNEAGAQVYTQYYSTFTAYKTMPKATVPSVPVNYTGPAPTYKQPDKPDDGSAERIAKIIELEKEMKKYYAVHDYNSIIKLANKFVDNNKNETIQAGSALYVTNAYLTAKKYAQFLNFLDSTDLYFDKRDDFNFAVADFLFQNKRFNGAYRYFFMAKRNWAEFGENNFGYSITLDMLGKKDEAESAFKALLQKTNNNPIHYYNRALIFISKDAKSERALNDLNVFISNSPEKFDAYLLRAKIKYARQDDHEGCMSDAKEFQKTHACAECGEMIKKSELEIIDRPRKAAVKEAKEKKDKENAIVQEAVRQKEMKEKAKKDSIDLVKATAAFNNTLNEYFVYCDKHNIFYVKEKEMAKKRPVLTPDYYEALKNGDLRTVFFLVKEDSTKWCSKTRLGTALEYRHFDIAELLLEKNCKMDEINELYGYYKKTFLLHMVCKEGEEYSEIAPLNNVTTRNVKIAKLLIDKGALVNKIDPSSGNWKSPLHLAVYAGNLGMVKMLLENGARFSPTPGYSNIPSVLAVALKAKHQNAEIIKLLKEHGEQ